MIDIDDCYYLGYIVKPKGLKGDFTIQLDVSDPADYDNLESVFVEINKQLVPFFLTSIRLEPKSKATISFEGDFEAEDVQQLKGSRLFLPLDILPELEGKEFYYHEVEGFELIDEKYGRVGIIKQIQESTAQDLIIVTVGEKEVLIPILDDTVSSLDREKQSMVVRTPNGLIELYLED